MINFLFILFFCGILVASIQDLRRREVDNYVNFFILASGLTYILFSAIYEMNFYIVLMGLLSLGVMFVLANGFYYGRVFAGGDAKLLIAMAALFVAVSWKSTLLNIGLFVLFLMISGAIWGIFYSLIMVFKNYSEVKMQIKKEIRSSYLKYYLIGGIVLLLLGFFNSLFLFFSGFVFLGGILFVFAKTVEKAVMIKLIDSRKLREGDWLVDGVKVGKKTIKPDWEGLTKSDLVLLRKINRKIKIKDGIPFVPAFFIAFLVFVFREQIITWFLGLI